MQVQLFSDRLTVSIRHLGAEMCSLKNSDGIEFIWQADEKVWPRHAPVLFPIVGKLKDNRFVHEGQSYHLGQHGFARDQEFELVQNDPSSCTFRLRSNDSTKQIYPFDFSFEISYRVEADTLITHYKVTNPSAQKPLLFSVGAHPGFNCPLAEEETLEDYFLEFERSEYKLTGLSNGLRTDDRKNLKLDGNRLFLTRDTFNNDALVFENGQINQISLCSSKSNHKITMNCEGWPYFGIWAKPGQPFVCLEPWCGIADRWDATQNLAEKDGIIRLEPGAGFECCFSVTVS